MAELVIEKLKSNFDVGARGNRFGTHFMCPKLGINLDGVRCKSASIPGRQLETVEWSAYGALHSFPTQVNHDGQRASFTFLCDSSFTDRYILEAWQLFILGNIDTQGEIAATHPRFMYQLGDGSGEGGYLGVVEVFQFNLQSDKALSVKLHDAFPVSIQTQQMDYGTSNEIMEVTVEFAFRYFTSEFKQIGNTGGATQEGIMGLINKGRKALDIIGDVAKIAGRFSPEADRFFKRISKIESAVDRATGIANKVERISNRAGNATSNAGSLFNRFFGG